MLAGLAEAMPLLQSGFGFIALPLMRKKAHQWDKRRKGYAQERKHTRKTHPAQLRWMRFLLTADH